MKSNKGVHSEILVLKDKWSLLLNVTAIGQKNNLVLQSSHTSCRGSLFIVLCFRFTFSVLFWFFVFLSAQNLPKSVNCLKKI